VDDKEAGTQTSEDVNHGKGDAHTMFEDKTTTLNIKTSALVK
jgi:hypothetical protein